MAHSRCGSGGVPAGAPAEPSAGAPGRRVRDLGWHCDPARTGLGPGVHRGVRAGVRAGPERSRVPRGRPPSPRSEHDSSGWLARRAGSGGPFDRHWRRFTAAAGGSEHRIRRPDHGAGRARPGAGRNYPLARLAAWTSRRPGDAAGGSSRARRADRDLAAGTFARRHSGKRPSRTHRLRWLTGAVVPIRAGAADARRLVLTRDWKLLGAVAYYVFDNAVLWAAFRAYGSSPPVGVLLMGYLVGSLGSALPIPAGLGSVEGGLIGALVLYGAPLAPAAAAVLLYRGISLGLAVALGGCGWAWRPRSRRARAADPGTSRLTSAPSIIPPRKSPAPRRRPAPAAAHSSE